MKDQPTNQNPASEGTSEGPRWPLPDAWSVPIPPQAVKIVEWEPYPGMKGTRPVWNTEWLRGLEAYVRSIVRDELRKANK